MTHEPQRGQVGANPEQTAWQRPAHPETHEQEHAGQDGRGGTGRHGLGDRVRVRDEEVAGSNPVTPTHRKPWSDAQNRVSGQGFRRSCAAFPEHGLTPSGNRRRVLLRVRVVERAQDAVAVVGPARVEVERGRRALVAHDPLHHVRRHPVVDEPRGVGVPQVVEAQPAGPVASNVVHGPRPLPNRSVDFCPSSSTHEATQRPGALGVPGFG
jgi:hypothetical protein